MNNVIGMNKLRKTVFQDLRYFGNLVPRLCLGGNLDLNKRFDAWGKFLIMESRWRSGGNLTLFEALAGWLFDHLHFQHAPREFDQNLQKSQIPRGLRGGMGSFVIDWYIMSAT